MESSPTPAKNPWFEDQHPDAMAWITQMAAAEGGNVDQPTEQSEIGLYEEEDFS